MEKIFEFNQEENWAIISIIGVTVLFLTYHFITSSNTYKRMIFGLFSNDQDKALLVIVNRVLGAIIFGIIPLLLILSFYPNHLFSYGINLENILISLLWILILSPIILLMNYFNAPKKDNLRIYPQIRTKTWTKTLLLISSLSWIIYLIGYEFMFRGFLLFTCYYSLSAPLAIAINVSIYSLVHLPKGIKETIGAIPLGLVLSVLTLITNSILIAIIVHVLLALTNEWFSIRALSSSDNQVE